MLRGLRGRPSSLGDKRGVAVGLAIAFALAGSATALALTLVRSAQRPER